MRGAPQLDRSPLRCDPPSKTTSNLSPARALLQRRLALAHPCSRRANLMIRTCLLAQGWRSTSTRSILITRSSCLVLQVRPRSDLDGLGAAVLSAAGWCSRAASSRATFSTSDDDHGVFGQLHFMNVLVVHFSTGLWFARVRAASRCVLERLSWCTEMVRDRIAYCSSVLVSLWFLSDL